MLPARLNSACNAPPYSALPRPALPCRLNDLPLYAAGISSGASFALKVPRLVKVRMPCMLCMPCTATAVTYCAVHAAASVLRGFQVPSLQAVSSLRAAAICPVLPISCQTASAVTNTCEACSLHRSPG